jgi:hypothetical protein
MKNDGEHREHRDLAPEGRLVLVLDAVVEAAVPVVEQHFQPDAGEGEGDRPEQQREWRTSSPPT